MELFEALAGLSGFTMGLIIFFSLVITILQVYLLVVLIMLAREGIKALKKYNKRSY